MKQTFTNLKIMQNYLEVMCLSCTWNINDLSLELDPTPQIAINLYLKSDILKIFKNAQTPKPSSGTKHFR